MSEDKKSFTTTLSILLDKDLMAESTTEDSQSETLRKKFLARDRKSFMRLGNYMAVFWGDSAVINDCINIDNRFSVPFCLPEAVSNRLHSTYPDKKR